MSDTEWQSESQAPAVSARATQGAEAHGRDWAWVEATVWSERMLAALENGVRGGKWFSLIDKVYRPQTLRAAWHKVKSNAGAAGVEGQSVERFEERAEQYLEELGQTLRAGAYRPQPIRRVEIPKGGGKLRPLGIPVVKDRIVQTALKLVIEPIFEREFEDSSYGFRPQRSAKDALREVDGLIGEGYTHVVGLCPCCGGKSILRYPSLKYFFHNCLITNDVESTKGLPYPIHAAFNRDACLISCQPSMRRIWIWPLMIKPNNNLSAARASGNELWVFTRRRNSPLSRSMALVVRSTFHWLLGKR